MQGFKSFPEKTVLLFDASITAIVGPNGSGKSNISDALRWVLGEQSTKALRSGRMEDVIFGGTEERKSLGFAQVSVIFDNEDGTLPIESTEVVLTRRYYRSGESEYYINRRLVRLRDINELFMDTGVGQDGYSLIGQGKIDEILAVKSKERREVFEEAAGISRFRHRKSEAERKLERTEENLLRIGDKMEELQLQLDPLSEQAARARRFFDIRERLRALEVSLWIKRLGLLREDRRAAEEAYEAMKRQLEETQRETDASYQKAERLSEEMREKEVQLETARMALSRKEEESAACDGRISVLEARMQGNEASRRRLCEEGAGRGARLLQLDEQMREKRTRLAQLEEEEIGANAALTEEEEALEAIRAARDACRQELHGLEGESREKEAALGELRTQWSALEAFAQEIRARRADVEAELAQRGAELAAARQEEEAARDMQLRLDAERGAAQTALGAAQAALLRAEQAEAAAKEEGTARRMEEHAASSRLRMLEEMEAQREGYSRAVKRVLERGARDGLRGIHGPVASLLTLPAAYTVAIEIALGGAMQNLVVEREEDGKAVFEYLRKHDVGRVTCLPMNAMRPGQLQESGLSEQEGFIGIAAALVSYAPAYARVFSNLLGRVVIVRDLDCGIAMARRYQYRFRIVTLDGQVIAPGGAMTGGALNRKSGILSRAKELEQLREEQKTLRARLADAAALHAAAQRDAATARAAREAAEQGQRAAEEACLLNVSKAEILHTKAEALEEQIRRLEQARVQLDARAEDSLSQSSRTQGQMDEESARTGGLSKERSRLEAQLADWERQQAAREADAGALRQRRAGIESEMRVGRASLQELAQLRELLAADDDAQQRELQRLEAEQQSLRLEEQRARAERQTLAAARAESKEKLEALGQTRMELEAARTQAEREGRSQNETLLRCQRETALLEQKKLGSEQEEAQLLDKLWEGYELSHQAALQIADPDIQLRETEREIGTLKQEIRALGTVNLGAIEEYERIRERFDFLLEQQKDVAGAAENLLSVIAELTGEMKEIFRREFARINEAFQMTFQRLFQGGRAELLLEDEEDILQCGIEIQVQPPGKKLSNLNLLSGGEKAFAAIALYFAILEVRPTPFCVLDEIEAALDEANVARFANYLREICEETQFILITHRRGTMEEADLLYGVTMERRGVSKLLRLNLSETEQLLSGV